MRKLRTLVVVHASLVPPESLQGYTDKQIEEWRTEYDVTTTMRNGGHEVRCIGVLAEIETGENAEFALSNDLFRSIQPRHRDLGIPARFECGHFAKSGRRG